MSAPTGALVVRVDVNGQPFFDAKWRRAGRQVKRRIGPAWLDAGPDGGWVPRRGRVPDGWFDHRRATVRMAELIEEHEQGEAAVERGDASGASSGRRCASWRRSGCTTSSTRSGPSRARSGTTGTTSASRGASTSGARARARG
jgi:hypothetical protein